MLWIPLDNLRQALRVEIREDDAELARLVKAAQAYIENVTGLTFGAVSKTQYLDRFTDFLLDGAPAIAITAISYEKAGVLTLLPATDYKLRYTEGPLGLVRFDTDAQPDLGSVQVSYICGFTSAVPHDIIQAGVALVAHWYSNVEAAAPVELRTVPFSAQVILQRRSVRSALR